MKSIKLALLLVFLILFSLSCAFLSRTLTGGGGGGASASTPTPDFTPKPLPTLPPPPAPLISTQANPDQQAGELADAIASAPDNITRLAAWLGVYQAIGMPVLNEDGSSVTNTGDDPLGPPYWLVWYFSGMHIPGRGISLADASHVFTAKPDGTFDSKSGQILLDDLRQLINSTDPQEQLLGYFIREQILRSTSKVDLMDPAANPDEMGIDVATVNLIQWVLARNMLFSIAKSQSSTTNTMSPVVYELPYNHMQESGGWKCSEFMGSETSTTVIKWMLNKLNDGMEIPLAGSFKGTVNLALEQLGASAELVTKVGEVKEYIKTAMSVYSFAAQLNSMMVEPDMNGALVRTQNIQDGNTNTIRWHLFYDRNKLPDGDDLTVCMINFVTSTYGDFTMPTAEDITGSEITFSPGENIPTIVRFDTTGSGSNYTMSGGNFSLTTKDKGIADLNVIGVGQKKNLPSSAKPLNKTFTILVSAQPEGITAKSIADQFMSSLAFWKDPGAIKLIEPVLGLLKTFHYSLGEHGFAVTDWSENVAYISDTPGLTSSPSPICDFEKPFVLSMDSALFFTTTFSPKSVDSGSWVLEGKSLTGTASGNGNYTIKINDVSTDAMITISGNITEVVKTPVGEYTDTRPFGMDYVLVVDPIGTCPEK